MAINPNTAFSSGAVFTADQANRFPRGVMGYAEATANYLNFTAIGTVLTVTFTAVANRYYRITYHEPQLFSNGAATNITMTIANGATALQQSLTTGNTTYGVQGTAITVETFTAGSITVVGCAKSSSTTGAPTMVRDATRVALLLVEDIGPA